jgi:ankyrin repeat protein
MSQLCLHYLLLPDIGDPNEYDFPKDKFAFLSYAAAHWPLHYGSQDSAAAEQCREDARMLCNMTGYYASLWVRDYFHQRGLWHYGWTDLALASYLGLKEVVQLILSEEETDVNAYDGTYQDYSSNYGTALQAASAEGHGEIVHILLDAGADVNLEGDGPYGSGQYGNALFAALARGHKEIVEVLVNNGADVNARCGRSGQALYVAALSGYEEIVQILLDAGADVNAHNEVDADVQSGQYCVYQRGEYDNALQAASVGGHEEIVKLLLEKGANVNVQGGRYNNALEAASDRGHEGIVKLLIDKGAEGYYIPDLSDPEDGMWGE